MGDSAILTQVLEHLIRNAVEYCGTAQPRVHISSQLENREWVISVKDNGPGIDPAFHDRIFGVFKRLHGKGLPRCRTGTRILQEGHRVAWRANLDRIDTRGRCDVLLHPPPAIRYHSE